MWPWGHLAVAYVLYTAFSRYRYRVPPTGWLVVALAVGSQFPDLVDKPLAYWVGVIPEGRSLAHSVLTVVPLSAVAVYVSRRRGQGRVGVAFAIGVFSHLLADSWRPVLFGRIDELTFLLWPVLPSPDYPTGSFIQHFHHLVTSIQTMSVSALSTEDGIAFAFQILLAAVVAGIWIVDGAPGLDLLWGKTGETKPSEREAD